MALIELMLTCTNCRKRFPVLTAEDAIKHCLRADYPEPATSASCNLRRWRKCSPTRRRVTVAKHLEERVKAIIVDQLAINDDLVVPTAKFADDLGTDSLDDVELIMALEEEFEITIPDEDAASMVTVQDAIDYVQKATHGRR
jgi:acyl carrier protein